MCVLKCQQYNIFIYMYIFNDCYPYVTFCSHACFFYAVYSMPRTFEINLEKITIIFH